jgi:hypothetical protein
MLHVLLAKYFIFFDTALCFLYVGFLFFIPLSMKMPLVLFISFTLGLFVDLFYDTPGIHSASCVAAMFLRPNMVDFLTPSGGYNKGTSLTIQAMGLRWFVVYVLVFCTVHHFFVFILEAFTFSYFWWTLLKIIFSTIFSSFMIVSFHFLLFNSPER